METLKKNTPIGTLSVGGIVFEIAKMKKGMLLYDFQVILKFLQAKGRERFGKNFQILPDDHRILYSLVNYFIQDEASCKELDLDIKKGILLTGPEGCGKTALMSLMRDLVPHRKSYEIIPARNLVFTFSHLAHKVIEDYGNGGYYCFDDLGVEPMGRYYGRDCNVMGEVLLSRYELFKKYHKPTHITTNLNAHELEERYGSRVRSRMREMFNLLSFSSQAIDKRK
ncbi:P-loop NTPase family protein [Robertkochia sediminum]|uniref:ATPase n=1 Tax=Robertkochia sediminum TaxID=2785326 RepID=UPI001933A45B|nr:ATPase [Robertkochia sediminum]